jgi:hypothetical protein
MLKTKKRLIFELFLQIIRYLAWLRPHYQNDSKNIGTES